MSKKSSRAMDMRDLIQTAKELAAKNIEKMIDAASEDALKDYLSRMNSGSTGRATIISAEDTAVELGAPKRASVNAVLWTGQKNLARDNRFHLIGPDLPDSKGADRDYCQVVLLEIDEGQAPDPFKLESGQFLPNRVPGVMARMIPGRLWLRVSKAAVSSGINFSLIAAAVRKAYREIPGVKSVECIFADSDQETVQSFAGIASEARILAGRHKRISLGKNGDYECAELNCESCEDKPVCDIIREVRVIRRRERAASRS